MGALLLALLFGVKQCFFAPEEAPSYVTATAELSDIEDAVLATGTLQALTQVSVGAQASGQVKSLKVALGDTVKKGQLVAEIDSVTQQNNVRNARAALDNVQAQLRARQATLKQAELTYARQKELLAADAASQFELEQAETALHAAQADIVAIQAQITQASITAETAQVTLGYTKILSPIDGVVVAIVTQEGQTVNANQNTPTIIKVAQLDTMTVKAQISEADVVRVRAGQKVYFTILGEPDQRYYATLRAIEPAPDSILSESTSATSGTTAIYYNGLFDVPNPEGKLRISMTAQVSVVQAAVQNVLSLPAAALKRRNKDGTYTVRVVGADGVAQPRTIKVGLNNNIRVHILEGLQANEKVVLGEANAGDENTNGTTPRSPRMRGF